MEDNKTNVAAATEGEQKPQEEKKPNYGFFNMQKNGITNDQMGNSDRINDFFLESKEEVFKQFEDTDISKETFDEFYEIKEKEYNALKDGIYTASSTSANEIEFGVTTGKALHKDLYQNFSGNTSREAVGVKFANSYSYLDKSVFKFKDPESGEMITKPLTSENAEWNPDLVIDHDKKTGDAFLRELQSGEDHYGYEAFHKDFFWKDGNHNVYGGSTAEDATLGFISGMGTVPLRVVSGMGSIAADLYGAAYEGMGGDKENFQGVYDFFDSATNFANRIQYRPADNVIEGGFTGSMNSFMYSMGNTMGEMTAQILTAGVLSGANAVSYLGTGTARVMAKKMLTQEGISAASKTAINNGLKYLGKTKLDDVGKKALAEMGKVLKAEGGEEVAKALGKSVMNKSMKSKAADFINKRSLIGMMQAQAGVYEQAKASGLEGWHASALGLIAGAPVYYTEKIFGGAYLKSKFGITQMDQAVNKVFQREFGEMSKNAMRSASSALPKTGLSKAAQAKMFQREYYVNMVKGFAKKHNVSFSKAEKMVKESAKDTKGFTGGAINKAKNYTEKLLNANTKWEDAWSKKNYLNGYFNVPNMMKGMMGEGMQESSEEISNIMMFYGYDNLKNSITNEKYEKGKGYMGYLSFKKDVLSDASAKQIKESFIGGLFSGGIMAGVTRTQNHEYGDAELFTRAAALGDTENLINKLRKGYETDKSMYGSPDHDLKMNVLKKNGTDEEGTNIAVPAGFEDAGLEEGTKLQSEADVNYFNMVRQAKLANQIYEETGLGIDSKLKNFKGQLNLFDEGMQIFKDRRDIITKANELAIKLKDEKTPKDQLEKLKTEKENLDEQSANLKEKFDFLMQPQENGFSKAYDYNYKNALAIMEVANDLAYENMSKNKEARDKNTPFDEEETKLFLGTRNEIVNGMITNDYYANILNVSSQVKNSLDQRIAESKERVKEFEGEASSDDIQNLSAFMNTSRATINKSIDDAKNSAKLAADSLKVNEEDSAKHFNNSLVSKRNALGAINSTLQELTNMDSSASKEILETMDGFAKELQEMESGVEGDPENNGLDLDTDAQTAFSDYMEYANSETIGTIDNKGEEQKNSMSMMNLVLGNTGLTKDASTIFNNRVASIAEINKDDQKLIEDTSTPEGYLNRLNSTYAGIFDNALKVLDDAKGEEGGRAYGDSNIMGLINNIKDDLQMVKMSRDAVKVRNLVFDELSKDPDREMHLNENDVPIGDDEATKLISELDSIEDRLKAHLDSLNQVAGIRDSYFFMERHQQGIYNAHFLHSISDVLFDEGIIDKSEKAKWDAIEFPITAGNKVYETPEIAEIEKIEKSVFQAFDLLNKKKDKIKDKEVLRKLLKSSVLSDGYIRAWGDRQYSKLPISGTTKVDQMETVTSIKDGMSVYLGENIDSKNTRGKGSVYGMLHYFNTLTSVLSDIDQKTLASTRMYINNQLNPEEKQYVSSTEQLVQENAIISYLNGGDKIFNELTELTKEIHLKDNLNGTADSMVEDINAVYKMNVASLLGDVQTGKSVQMIPQIILLQQAVNNESQHIDLVAHSDEVFKKFQTMATDIVALQRKMGIPESLISVKKHDDIINGNKNTLDNKRLVIIDEATIMSNEDINVLHKNVLSGNDNSNILFVGDDMQMPDFVTEGSTGSTDINSMGFKTMTVQRKYAAKNPMLTNLMNISRVNVNGSMKSDVPMWWNETNSETGLLEGSQYYTKIDDIFGAFVKRLSKKPLTPEQASLIFLTEEHYNDYKADNPAIEEYAKKGFVTVLGNDKNNASPKFDSIQGGRRAEVYIMYDGSKELMEKYASSDAAALSQKLAGQAMYTLIGRTSGFVAMYGRADKAASSRPANFGTEAEDVVNSKNEVQSYLANVYSATAELKPDIEKSVGGDAKFTDKQKASIEKIDIIRAKNINFGKVLDNDGNEMPYYQQEDENGNMVYVARMTSLVATTDSFMGDVIEFNSRAFDRNLDEKKKNDGYSRLEVYSQTGTIVDDLFRNVMSSNIVLDEKIKKELAEEFSEKMIKSGNVENKAFASVKVVEDIIKGFEKLKTELEARGEFLITDDALKLVTTDIEGPEINILDKDGNLVYRQADGVGGTADLITVDEQGRIRIYDLKNKNANKDITETSEFNFDSQSDEDHYTNQVNGYAAILEHETDANVAEVALIINRYSGGPNGVVNGKGMMHESNGSEIVPLRKADTNIHKGIRDYIDNNPKNPKEKYLDRYNDGNGIDIVVNEKYQHTQSKEVVVVRNVIDNNGNIMIAIDNSVIPVEQFNDHYSYLSDETIKSEVPIAENENAAIYSARIFANNSGNLVYSTPVSVAIEASRLESLPTDAPITETIKLIRKIKSKLANNGTAERQLVLKRRVVSLDDNGVEQAFTNVLVSRSTDLDTDFRNVKLTEEEKSLMRSLGKSLKKELFQDLTTISLPRYFDKSSGAWIKINDTNAMDNDMANDYFDKISSSYDENNKADNQALVDYNKHLFLLHLHGSQNMKGNEFTYEGVSSKGAVSDNIVRVTLHGEKTSSSVADIMSDSIEKGYEIGDNLAFHEVNDEKILGLPIFKNGKRSTMVLSVLTPTISEKKNKFVKKFFEEVKDLLDNYKGENKADYKVHPFGSVMHQFILNNKTEIQRLAPRIKLNNGKMLSDVLFIDNDNKVRYHTYTKDDSWKADEVSNVKAIASYILSEKGNSILGKMYLPSEMFGTNNMSELRTKVKSINEAPVYVTTADVLSINSVNDIFEKKDTVKTKKKFSDKRNRRSVKTPTSLNIQESQTAAKNTVAKILGDRYANEWLGFERDMSVDGVEVFGLMANGRIKLSLTKGMANKLTSRHEIFHVVDEYILAKETKDKIYGIVRENVEGYEKASENKIKEFLADWYGAFGSVYENGDLNTDYTDQFASLLNKIKGNYDMFKGEIAALFNDIETGKYQNAVEGLMNENTLEGITKLSEKPEDINDKLAALVNKYNKEETPRQKKKKAKQVKIVERINVKREKSKPPTRDENNDTISALMTDAFGTNPMIKIKAVEAVKVLFSHKYGDMENNTINDLINGSLTEKAEDNILFEDYLEDEGFTNADGNFSITLKNGITKDVRNIESSDIPFIEYNDEFEMYVMYKALNNNHIMKGLLQGMFKNYDTYTGKMQIKSKQNYSTDADAPGSNIQDKLNFLYSTFPLIREMNDGKHQVSDFFIPEGIVKSIFREASQLAATYENGDYYYKNFILALENLSSSNNSEKGMIFKSILARFKNGYTGPNYSDDMYDDVRPFSTVLENVITGDFGNITKVDKELAGLINAMLNETASYIFLKKIRVNKAYDYTNVTFLDGNFTNNAKHLLKDNIAMALYQGGRLTDVTKNSYAKLGNNEKDNDETGVEGEKVVHFDSGKLMFHETEIMHPGKNGGYVFNKGEDGNSILSLANQLAKRIGLGNYNHNVLSRLINDYSINKDNKMVRNHGIEGFENSNVSDTVATIMGNFFEIVNRQATIERGIDKLNKKYDKEYSSAEFADVLIGKGRKSKNHTSIVEAYNAEVTKLIEGTPISEELKAFNKSVNFSNSNVDGILGTTKGLGEDELIHDLNYPKVTDYYNHISVLADYNFNYNSVFATPSQFLAGKKMYPYEQGSTITNAGLNTSAQTTDLEKSKSIQSNNFLTKKVRSKYDKVDDVEKNKVLVYNNKGESTNALIAGLNSDDEAYMSLNEIDLFAGIDGEYSSYDKLSKGDNMQAIVSIFLNGLKKSTNKQNHLVLPIGYGKRFYFADLMTKKSKIIDKIEFNSNDQIKSFEFNRSKLIEPLKKNFKYQHRLAELSRERWADLLEDKPFLNLFVSVPEVEKLLMRNENGSYNGNIEDKSYDSLSNQEFHLQVNPGTEIYDNPIFAEIRNSDLIENADYRIIKKKDTDDAGVKSTDYFLTFGNDINFQTTSDTESTQEEKLEDDYVNPNSQIYTRDNYNSLMKGKGRTSVALFDSIMAPSMSNNNKLMELISDDDIHGISDFFKGWAKSQSSNFEVKSDLRAVNKVTGETIYNPVIQSLALMQTILMPNVNRMIAGNEGQTKGLIDYTKRFDPNATPKDKVVRIHRGLGKSAKAYIYHDEDVSTDLGSVGKYDGGTIGFVAFKVMRDVSYGGEYGKFEDTVSKSLVTGVNPLTGINLQIKHSMDSYSKSLFDEQDGLRQQQEELFDLWMRDIADINNSEEFAGINFKLLEKYESLKSNYPIDIIRRAELFNNYINDIPAVHNASNLDSFDRDVVEKFLEKVIDSVSIGFVPHDSVKQGSSNITMRQPGTGFESNNINDLKGVSFDMDNFGIINNYNKDTSQNATAAAPNQMVAHIGIGNPDIKQKISESLSNILTLRLESIFEDAGVPSKVGEWNTSDAVNFQAHLRKLGLETMSTNEGGAGIIDILQNGGSIQPIQVARKLEQYWNSSLNSALAPRFKGTKVIQSDGSAFIFYVDSNGDKVNKNFLMNKEGWDGVGPLPEGYSELNGDDAFSHMQFDGEGNFKHSEVGTAFIYAEMFGIKEGEQPRDGYTIKSNGKFLDYFGNIKNGNVESSIDSSIKVGDELSIDESPFLRVSDTVKDEKAKGTITVTAENINDIKDEFEMYLENYHKSLEVVLNRVPYDTPALGFVGRITYFVWGNGSTIYMNSKENIHTGGDYDIDQLSIYYKEFDSYYNLPTSDRDVVGNKNIVLDQMMEFYKRKENEDRVQNQTGVQDIEAALIKVGAKDKVKVDFHSLQGIVEMDSLATEGNDAISIFALSASAFGYMNQLVEDGSGSKTFVSSMEDIKSKTKVIGGFLQAALDNKKELLLGQFNVPKEAVNILLGLSTQGYGYEDIYEIVNSNSAGYIFEEMAKGGNIKEKKRDFINLLKDQEERNDTLSEDDLMNMNRVAGLLALQMKDGKLTFYDNKENTTTIIDASNYISKVNGEYAADLMQARNDLDSTDPSIAANAEAFFNLSYVFMRGEYNKLNKANAKLRKDIATESEKDKPNASNLERFNKTLSEKIDLQFIVDKASNKTYRLSKNKQNSDALKALRKGYVQSETLRRLGSVMKLRGGMGSDHNDSVAAIRNIELSLGMSLEEFLADDDINVQSDETSHLEYYKNNSNYYASNKYTGDQAYILEIESEIFNAGNISELVNNSPYFKQMLNVLLLKKQTMEKAFYINNPLNRLQENIGSKQNRVNLQYKNQLMAKDRFLQEVMLDFAFKNAPDQSKYTVSGARPVAQLGGTFIKGSHKFANLQMKDAKSRKIFESQFPDIIAGLKETLANSTVDSLKSYLSAMNIHLTIDEINNLRASEFFNVVEIRGNDGYNIIDVNPIVNHSPEKTDFYRKNFDMLPSKIKFLFELYHANKNRLQFDARGFNNLLSNDISRDIARVFESEELTTKFNDLLKSIDGGERMADASDYLGLDKNIRRKHNEEDPVIYATETVNYGNSRQKRPMKAKDILNTSGGVEFVRHNAFIHNGIYDSEADFNTVENSDIIKMESYLVRRINDKENINKSVTKTTLSPHGYQAGLYYNNLGEVVSVSNTGSFDVDIQLNSKTAAEYRDQQRDYTQNIAEFKYKVKEKRKIVEDWIKGEEEILYLTFNDRKHIPDSLAVFRRPDAIPGTKGLFKMFVKGEHHIDGTVIDKQGTQNFNVEVIGEINIDQAMNALNTDDVKAVQELIHAYYQVDGKNVYTKKEMNKFLDPKRGAFRNELPTKFFIKLSKVDFVPVDDVSAKLRDLYTDNDNNPNNNNEC